MDTVPVLERPHPIPCLHLAARRRLAPALGEAEEQPQGALGRTQGWLGGGWRRWLKPAC